MWEQSGRKSPESPRSRAREEGRSGQRGARRGPGGAGTRAWQRPARKPAEVTGDAPGNRAAGFLGAHGPSPWGSEGRGQGRLAKPSEDKAGHTGKVQTGKSLGRLSGPRSRQWGGAVHGGSGARGFRPDLWIQPHTRPVERERGRQRPTRESAEPPPGRLPEAPPPEGTHWGSSPGARRLGSQRGPGRGPPQSPGLRGGAASRPGRKRDTARRGTWPR